MRSTTARETLLVRRNVVDVLTYFARVLYLIINVFHNFL